MFVKNSRGIDGITLLVLNYVNVEKYTRFFLIWKICWVKMKKATIFYLMKSVKNFHTFYQIKYGFPLS